MHIRYFFLFFISPCFACDNLSNNEVFDVSPSGHEPIRLEEHYPHYKQGEQSYKTLLKYPLRIPEFTKTIFLHQKEAACLNKHDHCPYTSLFTSHLYTCIAVAIESPNKCALMHVDSDIDFKYIGEFIKRHFDQEKQIHIHVSGLNYDNFEEDDCMIYKSQTERIYDLIKIIEKFYPVFRCSISLYNKNHIGIQFGRSLGISLRDGVFHGDFYDIRFSKKMQSPDIHRLDSEAREAAIIDSNLPLLFDFYDNDTDKRWRAHYCDLIDRMNKEYKLDSEVGMVYPLEELDAKRMTVNKHSSSIFPSTPVSKEASNRASTFCMTGRLLAMSAFIGGAGLSIAVFFLQ